MMQAAFTRSSSMPPQLLRATTVPTYLKYDWFRDWGALQQLTPYYPGAEAARLDLGSATRSGLWSPAPLRLS